MIEAWVVAFTLVAARVGTFVVILPFFGSRSVPQLVRLGLTFALSLVWFNPALVPGCRAMVGHRGSGLGWPLPMKHCWRRTGFCLWVIFRAGAHRG